jgi:hypothetical protein
MDLYYDSPNGSLARGSGYIWLRLHGPGRVAIQSVFERVEGEEEFSKRYNRHSAMYPPNPPVSVVTTPMPSGKTAVKLGIILALIAFLVFWIRRATLPPGAGMKDYEAIIIPVLILVLVAITFLVFGLGFMLANARRNAKKSKP